MRVLVCGGRDFCDAQRVYSYLDNINKRHSIDAIIEGNARGADRIAGFWARKNGIDNLKFNADWAKYGKQAGSVRNAEMLRTGQPDLVVAFPGGRGTADMIAKSRAANLEVLEA